MRVRFFDRCTVLLTCCLTAGCGGTSAPPVTPDSGCAAAYEFRGLDRMITCAGEVTTVQVISDSVRSQAMLFLPVNVDAVDVVVVIAEGGGLGHTAFATGFWRSMCERFGCGLLRLLFDDVTAEPEPAAQLARNAGTGSGAAVLELLDSLASATAHDELRHARLVFWGFSGAGSFGPTFAARRPDRTLGFIRYNSNMRGVQVDTASILRTPGLLIAAEHDGTAGVEDSRAFWLRGREQGAPWAIAVMPGERHFSLDAWLRSSDLAWHWMEALIHTHRAAAQPDGAGSAWLGDPESHRVWPASSYDGDPLRLSWLPDSATAAAWQRLVTRQPQ